MWQWFWMKWKMKKMVLPWFLFSLKSDNSLMFCILSCGQFIHFSTKNPSKLNKSTNSKNNSKNMFKTLKRKSPLLNKWTKLSNKRRKILPMFGTICLKSQNSFSYPLRTISRRKTRLIQELFSWIWMATKVNTICKSQETFTKTLFTFPSQNFNPTATINLQLTNRDSTTKWCYDRN